ncbi:MAG: hypothetical protein Ct9H300mP21_01740 [Pseudomonadota bacterium]|nr:MAG: hypothetical protein Ct9H300mP21_01740 [Pseudomonadota bacterium]
MDLNPLGINWIVAVEAEYEQVDFLNNLVLAPLPNYKRSEFLDRQALGFLTREGAILGFGELIWSNRILNSGSIWGFLLFLDSFFST